MSVYKVEKIYPDISTPSAPSALMMIIISNQIYLD